MNLNFKGMIKMTDNQLMFYGLYMLATLLGIIAALIVVSVYNKNDFFILKNDNSKFYGLFVVGFVMCSLTMNSAISYSGWTNLFLIISSLLGIALLLTLIVFYFNIQVVFLSNKTSLIYFLASLIFVKVGLATVHRILVVLS